jgi:hypothetical protein
MNESLHDQIITVRFAASSEVLYLSRPSETPYSAL